MPVTAQKMSAITRQELDDFFAGKDPGLFLPAKIGCLLYLAKKSWLPDGADQLQPSSEMTSLYLRVAIKMPRRPARITQADVARAVRAAK